MSRPLKGRPSFRDTLIANRRALDHMADMAGRPRMEYKMEIKPKRAYTRRVDGSSEHEEQCAVIQWWNAQCGFYGMPHFALFAVPNGAHLASGYIGAGKLKREGLRPGMLDLVLAKPMEQFHGLFIEMKYGKNKPSDDQIAVEQYLKSAGYAVGMHWSADSAIAAIKEYLA